MVKVRKELEADKGSFGIMLGGAHCSFRREIKPYEQFEIWTRVLAWDRKWLYVVSHFVKKGKVEPRGWTLQPWRKSKSKGRKEGDIDGLANGNTEEVLAQPHPAIYASAIAKYVFKKGRLTIAPARVLEGSGLLPPKPAQESAPLGTPSPMPNGHSGTPRKTSLEPASASVVEGLSAKDVVDASFKIQGGDGEVWNWQRIEDERVRGMKLAESFNSLDGISGEFRGGDDHALGVFSDLF